MLKLKNRAFAQTTIQVVENQIIALKLCSVYKMTDTRSNQTIQLQTK